MPFKPLSNALLNPYKAPFKNRLCNYLITKNLRRLLNNSSLTHFPTFSLHFCQYISRGGGCQVVGVEWWVLMVSIKFIVNPHIIIPQHSIPHIINTHHPTFNPSYHQHPTFITQHHTSSSPNIQSLISSTLNIHHPTPNIQSHTSSTPNIHHPTPNIHHPTPNIHHPSPIISHPINFIISFFLCKFAVK